MTIDNQIVKQIDSIRGLIPRSAFIEQILMNLEKNDRLRVLAQQSTKGKHDRQKGDPL